MLHIPESCKVQMHACTSTCMGDEQVVSVSLYQIVPGHWCMHSFHETKD